MIPVLTIFSPLLTYFLRAVVVKFLVFTAVIALVTFLVPFAVKWVAGFISPQALNGAFNGIPDGVWYFADFFALDYGLPLVFSALVSRFLIRRLPVIG